MSGENRRDELLRILQTSTTPVSGDALAKKLDVSRQVIVTDIALLRAKDLDIYSTNRGYVLGEKSKEITKVFKVIHSDEEVEKELETIVDLGGHVKDIFVYHKVYGVVKADMNIGSRRDIKKYISDLESGKSSQLKNVTSGFHYHTITAKDLQTLDLIYEELEKLGFLAKLQEYEPVDFWHKDTEE